MTNSFIGGKISSHIIDDYKTLEYFHKPFGDEDTIKRWKSLGHYYEKYTGFMRDSSNNLPDWCFGVAKEFGFKDFSITLYYMNPGIIMPEHSDAFLKYRQVMNLKNSDDVWRAVVFLEDWKSGHYFEIDETPIVNWKKGDYILWKNDIPHMAANIGKENRYTMQITGIY